MNLFVNFISAIKAIKKNRKRSLLTAFGIIIGVASVISVMSLGRGFEKNTVQNLTKSDKNKFEIQIDFVPYDSTIYQSNLDFFNYSDILTIDSFNGIAAVDFLKIDSTVVYKEIQVKEQKKNKQIELITNAGNSVENGRSLTLTDNELKSKVAIIDTDLALELFGSENSAINKGIEIEEQLFTIVGVYKEDKESNSFLMPKGNIQIPKRSYLNYFDKQKDTSSLTVTLENAGNSTEIISDILEVLSKKGSMCEFGQYEVFDTTILSDGVSSILSTITYFVSAIAGISLFIAGVGVMNMMYISVSERTKEIGIRRALGATRTSIMTQFLLEGLLLTITGGIIGYILGVLLALLVGMLLNIPISIDFFTVSLALGISSSIGLIFSVVPAAEAARKDLINILK